MPPRASRRVAAAADTAAATAAAAPTPPTRVTVPSRKRARGTATATAENADSDSGDAHDHSQSNEHRPTRRARGSDRNELGAAAAAPSATGAAAVVDTDPDHSADPATASGRRSRSRTPAAAASSSSSAPAAQRAKGRKAAGAGADADHAAAATPSALHLLGDPLLAPVRRCDSDSLSLVFALLNTADFLAAIRVCRQWHAARMKHTAWPKLHLASFIRSLRDDDYDNPARRRLEVRLMHRAQSRLEALLIGAQAGSAAGGDVGALSAENADGRASSSSAATAAAAAPAAVPPPPSASASMWRHVTDLKLLVSENSFPSSIRGRRVELEAACDRALQQIAQLPYLSALNLHECAASDAGARGFFSAVADRLQALLLFGGWDSRTLHAYLPLLRGLRVLVLDREPPLFGLDHLTQLRYLHFDRAPHPHAFDERLARTLRWLSQAHQLRSLSVDSCSTGLEFDFGSLFQPPIATDAATARVPSAALLAGAGAGAGFSSAAAPGVPAVDWSQPCCLTDVSLSGRVCVRDLEWLGRLPHLRRLQAESHGRSLLSLQQQAQPLQAHVAVLGRLRQLRLCLRRVTFKFIGVAVVPLDWRHVQMAAQLRVLQLSSIGTEEVPAATLQSVLSACAATLEELRLGSDIRIIHAAATAKPSETDSAAAAAATAPGAASAAPASGTSADGADTAASTSFAAASAAVDTRAAAASSATTDALAPLGAWSVLARCSRLRVLQLELQCDAPASIYDALSLLPSFQSLELTLRGKQRDGWPAHGLLLPPTLLPCIVRSRSWCSVHIYSTGGGSAVNLLRTGGGLAQQMPVDAADQATARRLRVHGHSKGGGDVRSYGIRGDDVDGSSGGLVGRQWQLL